MAGLTYQTTGRMKIQQGISAEIKQQQTQILAQESPTGPSMHPQGKNLFLPGHASQSRAMVSLDKLLNNKRQKSKQAMLNIIIVYVINNIQQMQELVQQSAYTKSYQCQLPRIVKYEQFYRVLLTKYKICIGCVYRIFSIMSPKLYSDPKTSAKLMLEILTLAENKCKEQQVKENYRFMVGHFKIYYQQFIQYQNEYFCSLCSGILQQEFLVSCCKQIMDKVKAERYEHKNKYKLNVKIHNIFSIKFQVFCNLVLADLQKTALLQKQQINSIRKQIVFPLFEKTGLDLKTVLKWKLSNVINLQPSSIFTLNSTINEDEQTVIVSLQIQSSGGAVGQQMTNLLGPYLNFQKQKSKGKKGRIQLQDTTVNYEATWTNGLISKINIISSQKWQQMLQKFNPLFLVEIQSQSAQQISIKISLQSQNILFCGRYVKFSRYLSQTPWVINKERLIHSSLQDEVQRKIIKFFYPPQISEDKVEIKFHAGGRQDIDVRMLKGGRPFVIQFVNPRICLSDIPLQQIYQKIANDPIENRAKLPKIDFDTQYKMQQQLQIKQRLLQFYINNSTELAKVYGFKKTTSSYISKQLKQAEIQKIKHYVCYIKSEQQLTEQDRIKLQGCHNLAVLQKTPVRVLHRRTLMYRDKIIHKMLFHKATKYSAVLEIWASAGAYIKQFVHGDLNRTVPNVGSIIGKSVDILQLDVGSLKEGQWVEGDYEHMKLGSLPWQNQYKQ